MSVVHEYQAEVAYAAVVLGIISMSAVGILLFGDHAGFMRDQAIKCAARAHQEQEHAQQTFGPIRPVSYGL